MPRRAPTVWAGDTVKGSEPPDWALPSWDSIAPEAPGAREAREAPEAAEAAEAPAGRPPNRPPAAPGTFGVRILGVSEVTRAIRGAVRADPRLARPVGRGRDRPGDGLVGGSRLLRAEGRAQPAPVRLVPRRPAALGVRGAGRAAGRRPRPDRPVRAAGRAPALRRVDPAGRARRPDPPVRGAQGPPRRRGPVRRGAQAAAAVATGDDRGHHQPDRGGLEGHLPRPRATLAADAGRPRRCPGPGRGGAGEPRRRASGRSSATPPNGSRPGGPTRRQRSRSWPAAADRSRTSGRSTTRRVVRAVVAHAVPVVCGVGHEVGRHARRLRRRRPGADAVGRGRDRRPGPDRVPARSAGTSGRRLDGVATARLRADGPRGRSPSGGRSTGSARRPSSRAPANGSGLLLDRATRAIDSELAIRRRAGERLARAAGADAARSPGARSRRDSSARTCSEPLAVRRRRRRPARRSAVPVPRSPCSGRRRRSIAATPSSAAADGAIVRDPAEAPPGTRLDLRVARGELPATADDR